MSNYDDDAVARVRNAHTTRPASMHLEPDASECLPGNPPPKYEEVRYQVVRSGQPQRPSQIICPNAACGYRGEPAREPRGSVAVGVILCFLFLLPGILYFIFFSGWRYYCPRCGMQIASDR